MVGGCFTGVAGAAEGWRCTAASATAYRQDTATGKWKTLVIPVEDQRFRVRPARSGPAGKRWELVREGTEPLTLPCAADVDTAGSLHCGAGDEFVLNRETLVFESHLFSSANSKLTALTALTAAGTCSPL